MSEPRISVVVATRDRSALLRKLLASLDAQTLPRDEYEVIVVDDGSTDDTAEVLAEHPGLRVMKGRGEGPAGARQAGWGAARAPIVAFTDDDCTAVPGWLEAMVAAADEHPGAVIMGRTRPSAEEEPKLSPFTHTVVQEFAGPPYQTCNILYPRDVLERIGGFDLDLPVNLGEDTDLAWRAIKSGAGLAYAENAEVNHAVVEAGPIGALRQSSRWGGAVDLFRRHPDLRGEMLHRGVFWSVVHEQMLRAIVALLLPRRLWPLALWLAWPYAKRLVWRRTGPVLAPFIALRDTIELVSILRGALRSRVLVI